MGRILPVLTINCPVGLFYTGVGQCNCKLLCLINEVLFQLKRNCDNFIGISALF